MSHRYLHVVSRSLLAACLLGCLPLAGELRAEDDVNFSRDIRPILAANCFQCHGPDEDAREAELRLDLPEAAYQVRDSGAAIAPGKPEQSELYLRITTDDEDLRMPPPDSQREITSEQAELVRRWIAAGAKYTKHWSFIAPQRPKLPRVEATAWPVNPIDHFVLRRLEDAGWKPSPPADRFTLARRAYLDLTGLPPTPAEADAFVADEQPAAYERLVDRLLASPQYGEYWARRWLDLARYSDTNGYEKDRPRTMWPYRDWVIQAYNADLPFDQFTVEQLAGDMLPNATLEQRIATGFHRNTMFNEEGGVDLEEFRYYALVDRVSTTGATWLGLTLACVQCHSHKYDPISHTEFFQMFAFLNNADELELPTRSQKIATERARLDEEISSLLAALATQFPLPADDASSKGGVPDKDASGKTAAERRARNLQQCFEAWTASAAKQCRDWRSVGPLGLSSTKSVTFTILADASVLVSGDNPNNNTYVVELPAGAAPITALRLEALPDPSLPAGGPGRAIFHSGAGAKGDFLLGEVELFVARNTAEKESSPTKIAFRRPTHSHAAPKGRSAELTIDGKYDTGWSIGEGVGRAHHIVLPLEQTFMPSGAQQRLVVKLHNQYIHQMTLGRFRISFTSDAAPQATTLPAEIESILLRAREDWSDAERRQLRAYYLSVAPELAEQRAKIEALRKKRPEFPASLVMQERTPQHARQTHRHHRGEFLKPREVVTPGVPASLHAWPTGLPRNRLGFARWLVDQRNPLTARVVMNRQWGEFFGGGIVRTMEDFGLQGETPTHPKLLDWLAVEFQSQGWSIKQMHRLIVTSAAYRQSSRVTAEQLRQDPENRLLARGPRGRVSAETVRDIILADSGLLSGKQGGPSVFPSQPAGITEAAYGPLKWVVSAGEDRYRRGLYTFNKRTAPYAAFGLFDAPSGEACVPRRDVSNTPLQALAMLNDEVVMQAARALARRALQQQPLEQDAAPQRAAFLFRQCLTRPPQPDELQLIVAFQQQERAALADAPDRTAKILGVVTADKSKTENVDQDARIAWAAWTLVARSLLNLDAALSK